MTFADPALTLSQFQGMCHVSAGAMLAPINGRQDAPGKGKAYTVRSGCDLCLLSG